MPHANGYNPKVAVDPHLDSVHIVWNDLEPNYGILHAYQNQSSRQFHVESIPHSVHGQTPAIAFNSLAERAIVWGNYSDFQFSLAIYASDGQFLTIARDDILSYSLWPRIAAGVNSNEFHLVFQGKDSASAMWGVYHLSYNATEGTFGSLQPLDVSGTDQVQTPVIAVNENETAVVIYSDTTQSIMWATVFKV